MDEKNIAKRAPQKQSNKHDSNEALLVGSKIGGGKMTPKSNKKKTAKRAAIKEFQKIDTKPDP